MSDALLQLALFSAKTFILALFVIVVLATFFILIAKSKEKTKAKFVVKDLNEKYRDVTQEILQHTLNKKSFKKYLKEQKAEHKVAEKSENRLANLYVIHFQGDIKASAVNHLREEISAVLNVATAQDEVMVTIDSSGGLVNTYGLAAAQLMRLRARQIPLTVAVDKVAASGGYLMACVANKILAAPFAFLGSIGVVVQFPNFNRVLKDKHIDYEMFTAGEHKRTVTLFGENTAEGRQKLKEEINDIHQLFKNTISTYRPHIEIEKVATGEYWPGQQAIELKLVDEIKTSDDYLLEKSKTHRLLEISYEIKKPFFSRLGGTATNMLGLLNPIV